MDEEDDFDDFSHLPTVDASPSAEEKRALWKKHSRRPPPVPGVAELEEADALHHQPAAESHAAMSLAEEPPARAEEPAEVPDWVREAFSDEIEIEADAPPPPPRRQTAPETISFQRDRGGMEEKKEARTAPKEQTHTHEQPTARSTQEEKAPLTKSEANPGKDRKVEKARAAQPEPEPPAHLDADRVDESLPRAGHTEDRAPKPPAIKPPSSKEKPDSGEHRSALPPPPLPGTDIATEGGEPVSETKRRFQAVWDKIGGRALAASLAVHAVLLIIATLVIVAVNVEKEVDFLPGGQSAGASEAAASLKHQVQKKKNPWLKNKAPLKRVVSTNISPDITLPEAPPDMMDIPDMGSLMKLGSMGGGAGGAGNGFGKGQGMGGGLGFAGQINFMGNRGIGRNVVFVVDVSGSMSTPGDSGTGKPITRFQLLKIELVKSLSRLPPGTQYQVIYFSDFAWAHNEVDSTNGTALEKARWVITPDKTGVSVPRFRYLNSDSATVMKSREIIEGSDNPGGTNWGSGLFMALKAFPKPDVIFFMTDGQQEDSIGWVDAVTRLNNSTTKRTIIHTTAMMEPSAAVELEDLAKRNGGNFTVVTAQGFIKTADEFFGRKPAEPK